MNIALTGGTGFIGSHVLAHLVAHGHEVTALARDDPQGENVASAGAWPVVVDLYDQTAVIKALAATDAAVHTASPGDATSAQLDSSVVDAVIEAFGGTGRPYIHTGGIWVYGSNPSIRETSPLSPPGLVAWREEIERRLLAAPDLRGAVIVPSLAYGDQGGGTAKLLLASPRDADGKLIVLGTGEQHWTTGAPDRSSSDHREAAPTSCYSRSGA